jgi:signal transduction histidine kinase
VRFLFPGDAERDPGFKEEIRQRSLRGVYIIAGVTAFMPFLALLFHGLASLFEPEPQTSSPSRLVLLTLAGCVLAATRTELGRRHARPLAFAMGIGVTAIITWSSIFEDPGDASTIVLGSMIDVMVVLMVSLAAIPAKPLQMFAYGAILFWIDLGWASIAASQGLMDTPPAHYYSAGHLIAVLCGALSGLTYQLLHNSYLGQREQLTSQSRLLHSETAMSFARLSATLSHELNSPLGTLRSSVSSLQTIAAKEDAPEANKERIRGLQRDLLDGSKKAVEKISNMVDRIQRITNLDRAEVTQVEVDKMLQDVAQMVRAEDEAGSEIRLTTTKMPAVKLKPQPISSVFSRLMHNAVKAGAGRGPVEVNAGRENDEILVSVQDHGEGLSNQELLELFQPGFKTRDGRVEASKWGLFTARQVIREHGGDISATRADNGGTRILVRLPVDGATGSISQ